jgi:hypothetical protein
MWYYLPEYINWIMGWNTIKEDIVADVCVEPIEPIIEPIETLVAKVNESESEPQQLNKKPKKHKKKNRY